MEGDDGKVFHRLRVSAGSEEGKALPRLNVKGQETHVLYNGISANAWLMPIGVVARRRSTGGEEGGSLHEQCQRALAERARSATFMLGQRHYDLPRRSVHVQDMPPRIEGKHLGPESGENTQVIVEKNWRKKSVEKLKTRPVIKFSDRAVPLYRKTEEERVQKELRVITKLRPKTAPPKVPKQDPPPKEFLSDNLTIVKLDKSPETIRKEMGSEHRKKKTIVTGDEFVDIFLNEENAGQFTTVNEMTAAYRAYLMKLPTGPDTLHVNTPNETRLSSAASRRSRVGSSRTKRHGSGKPRNLSPRNRFHSPEAESERPRSSWRPLLGCEDEDTHGSMGCTHRCRQCFSACLASEDYLEHMHEDKSMLSPNNNSSNKNTKSGNGKKNSNGSTSEQKPGWGVKAGRKRLKAVVRDHPEGEGNPLLGLSISFFSPVAGSHAETLEELMQEEDRDRGKSEIPDFSTDGKFLQKEIKLKRRKRGIVRSVGQIARAISNAKGKVTTDVESLEISGASLQENENEETPHHQKPRWDFFQLRTFHRPGFLAPLPTYDIQKGMRNLNIQGSPKPQHRRYESEITIAEGE